MRPRPVGTLAPLMGLALLACGCAESGLRPGTYRSGYVLEVQGSSPSDAASAVADAKRRAVAGLIGAYVGPRAQADSAEILESKVLAQAGRYVKRSKVKASGRGRDGAFFARLRALVAVESLSKDLESLGLVSPDGVRGRPRLLLALSESWSGKPQEPGLASDAMRRHLLTRGYQVLDLSDPMNREHRKAAALFGKGERPASEDGGPKAAGAGEALAVAKKLGAQVLVTGSARAKPAPDDRLRFYQPTKAEISVRAVSVPEDKPLASFSLEASAVDVSPEGAAARALANAGELAGERLRSAFGDRYEERRELSVTVLGLGGFPEAQRFAQALRGLPVVVAASVAAAPGRDARLRVFVERLSADELTAHLLRLKPWQFQVRSVEPDFNAVELELAGMD